MRNHPTMTAAPPITKALQNGGLKVTMKIIY